MGGGTGGEWQGGKGEGTPGWGGGGREVRAGGGFSESCVRTYVF